MNQLLQRVRITVNDRIYLKDPMTSNLGNRILTGSIDLICDMGFEHFTFRKLSQCIKTSEASIYRYFESKNKLLLYLTAWYWGWMEYQLAFSTANIESPTKRLSISLRLLTEPITRVNKDRLLNLKKLYQIVITESSKSYLVKSVDEINKDGVYLGYKNCVGRVSDIVLEINPDYPYPHMLISTVIEGAHHQRYFAAHLPRLTDTSSDCDSVVDFYSKMVFATIGTEHSVLSQLS